MQPIHILKPGSFTDAHGQKVTFTEADLAALSGAYDPKLHEAPLVVGHPAHDTPAYGWVEGLKADQSGVYASVHQVDASLAEMVSAGRYKKSQPHFMAQIIPTHRPKSAGIYVI